MKLQYNSQDDRQELNNLIKLFILSHKGQVVDSQGLSVETNNQCGIYIDYHEYLYVLDILHTAKIISVYGYTTDGITRYYIN